MMASRTAGTPSPVLPARVTDGHTADGVIVGTPGFMPPEQASGSAATADARSDVFGLGAILDFILSSSAAPVPRPLAAIAKMATLPDPASRYQTVEALASDVKRWLDGEPVQAYRERAMERVTRVYRRNQALILLLAAYAIVRVTILLWRGV